MAKRVLLQPIRDFFVGRPPLVKIFEKVHKFVMNLDPSVVHELGGNFDYFAGTEPKPLCFLYITRTGKVVMWTGGEIFPGLEPVRKRPAWGSIKIQDTEQLSGLEIAIRESLDHFLFTMASGQSVSWNAPIPKKGRKKSKKKGGDF